MKIHFATGKNRIHKPIPSEGARAPSNQTNATVHVHWQAQACKAQDTNKELFNLPFRNCKKDETRTSQLASMLFEEVSSFWKPPVDTQTRVVTTPTHSDITSVVCFFHNGADPWTLFTTCESAQKHLNDAAKTDIFNSERNSPFHVTSMKFGTALHLKGTPYSVLQARNLDSSTKLQESQLFLFLHDPPYSRYMREIRNSSKPTGEPLFYFMLPKRLMMRGGRTGSYPSKH